MKNSNSIQFASAKRTEDDVLIDLYCEVLMAYMLVESALGECDLRFELGAALDSGERKRLQSAWSLYQNLPNQIKEQILRGDAGFEQSMLEGDDERIPEVAGKKTGRKSWGKSSRPQVRSIGKTASSGSYNAFPNTLFATSSRLITRSSLSPTGARPADRAPLPSSSPRSDTPRISY